MKQFLLALILVAVPVAAFTGFQLFARESNPVVAQSLGDLGSFKAIIADVQAIAARGDLPGAASRITDYESAWDNGKTAIRPLNPNDWGKIDAASDAAIKVLGVTRPWA